jgi:N-acetylglucosamine kinase-like BadF-type ATPase
MTFVLGVDGGNTKTIALVADGDGVVLGSGRGGCSDIYGAGSPEAALVQIDAAVGAALHAAGVAPDGLDASAFSLAGADWPEDFALLRAALEQRGFGRNLDVVNDGIGGLRAGSPDGCGVAVICGTGVATAARAPGGRLWWTSYWQEPQGAYELGRKVLRAILRAELGLDPPTRLTAHVLALFGVDTVEEVLHRMTGRDQPEPPRLDRLAPALMDEAAAGDPTARRIVEDQGAALGDYALVAARKVGLAQPGDCEPFTLVLSGGVLRHPTHLLRDALIGRVAAQAPGVRPVTSRFEPAAGALLLAYDLAGRAVDEALLERLAGSLPEAGLFSTRGDGM